MSASVSFIFILLVNIWKYRKWTIQDVDIVYVSFSGFIHTINDFQNREEECAPNNCVNRSFVIIIPWIVVDPLLSMRETVTLMRRCRCCSMELTCTQWNFVLKKRISNCCRICNNVECLLKHFIEVPLFTMLVRLLVWKLPNKNFSSL